MDYTLKERLKLGVSEIFPNQQNAPLGGILNENIENLPLENL